MNWEGIRGLEEAIGDVFCADCEWRLRVTGPDSDAVQRAMSVALADHQRAYHDQRVRDG